MDAATTTPAANGHATRDRVEEILVAPPLTEGYRPTLPLWALYSTEATPQLYLLRDIEIMMIHPMVHSVLDYYKGGVAMVEFDVSSPEQEVMDFCHAQLKHYWDVGVPAVQGGYEYGWIGLENQYRKDEAGNLAWDHAVQFSPRDVFLLTQDFRPVGVRVKSVQKKGQVDLWMSSEDVPAKALWYAHRPRYNAWYGQSQLLAAWRPWRRLAWKDAAETVIDTGVYRFAYCGPEVHYPEEDFQASSPGPPGTTLDSQGYPRRFARDVARQMCEWAKTGAGIGLPSTPYPATMGGGPKWQIKWPEHVLQVDPLIGYAKYLHDQICYGIGVPPELLQSSETGSGYSGRAIPLEAFIVGQQKIADALLHMFVEQVLKPLVRWNFGKVPFVASVKPLLETKLKARNMGGEPANQPGEGTQQQPPDVSQQSPTKWSPYTSATGEQGWQSEGGQVRLQPGSPGAPGMFSLNPAHFSERVREISRLILGAAA